MLKRLLALMVIGVMPSYAQTYAQTILVHAHRGGRAARPENTIPSFQNGIRVGADVLELDLAVTKDNVLVVSHSPYLTQPASEDPRMAAAVANERRCDGPALPPGTAIHSLTLAQLKQYDCGSHQLPAFPAQQTVPHTTIPTFEEVLDLAPQGSFQFNVETKIFPTHPELTPSPEVFVKMIDDIVRRRHLQSRIILQSFDFRTLHAMRAIDPQIRLSALFGRAQYDSFMGITDGDKGFAHIARITGAEILSPDDSLVTPEEVAQAHKIGVQVAPYTINTPEGWRRMADAHVDAIITDDPAGLLSWLRSQHPPLHP
ncbi:glycerophosphodiester phosphodiesterase [Granulicella sp. WH15]|uniref:glycerophosphodiester phosphodiesterase family protein n=1 Tax=Granulicella sp. WH15 TaxID=2602070 RepID=UPI001367619F|nr:glycerophosphodiester phosphodiesterase family protein [Granulicella sp. WH15]QHN02879.1 glycerophosphodiester phosphodiesterase [Granulicella sp. WH15]